MGSHRLRFLIAPILLLSLASCGRYIVGGAGKAGGAIPAIPPARSVDISFQTAISDDDVPAIALLPGGGAVACQIITPRELGVSRLDDSLRTLWSTHIPLTGAEPQQGGPLGLPRMAPAVEHPIRLVATDRQAALFSYQRLAGDSMELKMRQFDLENGRLLNETVIHRGSFAETLPEEAKIYHSVVSPDGGLILIYMISGEQSGFQRQFDLQLFRSDLTLAAAKRVYVTGRTSRDTLQSIAVDNAGMLYLLHQDDRSSLDVVRLDLFKSGTPERIVAKLADTANSMMRLEPFTMKIEKDSTLTAMAVGRIQGGRLDGIAVVRIDLKRWAFLTSIFHDIDSTMLSKLIGTPTMEQPRLQSILQLAGGEPHWIAVIEERKPSPGIAGAGPDRWSGISGNIVSVAFDSIAQMMWLRGTSRPTSVGPFAIGSTVTQGISAAGVFRVLYNGAGDFLAREYYLGNGADLTPVPRRLLAIGENGSVLLPYTVWLNDRTALLTVLADGGRDVRLCRLDLAR